MTKKDELIRFEDEIKELYLQGKIRSPIHLSKGNEEQLIEIFKRIKPADWVFSNHRSHFHALLHNIDPEWLKAEILANRSIHINNAQHKFFSSAIVGGICPIALGVALALKLKGSRDRVWAFCGDMAGETGIFYECTKYASRNALPITFVIEDNYFSINTPTQESWGLGKFSLDGYVERYEYNRILPHSGTGIWQKF